ncbi:hypothetical protein DMUE_0530 [Dictyocoela muelleri]|nr:hypothetical protein DMUE_0530 [Dictyocoela muelleri]
MLKSISLFAGTPKYPHQSSNKTYISSKNLIINSNKVLFFKNNLTTTNNLYCGDENGYFYFNDMCIKLDSKILTICQSQILISVCTLDFVYIIYNDSEDNDSEDNDSEDNQNKDNHSEDNHSEDNHSEDNHFEDNQNKENKYKDNQNKVNQNKVNQNKVNQNKVNQNKVNQNIDNHYYNNDFKPYDCEIQIGSLIFNDEKLYFQIMNEKIYIEEYNYGYFKYKDFNQHSTNFNNLKYSSLISEKQNFKIKKIRINKIIHSSAAIDRKILLGTSTGEIVEIQGDKIFIKKIHDDSITDIKINNNDNYKYSYNYNDNYKYSYNYNDDYNDNYKYNNNDNYNDSDNENNNNNKYSDNYNDDNTFYATASQDTTIKIWRGGKLIQTLKGHQDRVNEVIWINDNNFDENDFINNNYILISVSSDNTVIFWGNIENKWTLDQRLGGIMEKNKAFLSVFNENKYLWVLGLTGFYKYHRIDSDLNEFKYNLIEGISGHQSSVLDLDWKDGFLMSCGKDMTVRIYQRKNKEQNKTIKEKDGLKENLKHELKYGLKDGLKDDLKDDDNQFREISRPVIHGYPVFSSKFFMDRIVVGSDEPVIRIFNPSEYFLKLNGNDFSRNKNLKKEKSIDKNINNDNNFINNDKNFINNDNKNFINNFDDKNFINNDKNLINNDNNFIHTNDKNFINNGNNFINNFGDNKPIEYVTNSELSLTNEVHVDILNEPLNEKSLSDFLLFKETKKLYGHYFSVKNIVVKENYIFSVNKSRSTSHSQIFIWKDSKNDNHIYEYNDNKKDDISNQLYNNDNKKDDSSNQYNDNNNQLYNNNNDNRVYEYNYDGLKLIQKVQIHDLEITRLRIKNNYLIACSRDRTFSIYKINLNSDNCLEFMHRFYVHKRAVNDSILSPDLKFIASISDDKRLIVKILKTAENDDFKNDDFKNDNFKNDDFKNDNYKNDNYKNDDDVLNLSFDNELTALDWDKFLFVGDSFGFIYIFDDNFNEIYRKRIHNGRINCIRVDGNLVATGGDDWLVRIFEF